MLTLLSLVALAAEPPTVAGESGKGITVTSADGDFSMSVKGRFQLRQNVNAAAPDEAGERVWTLGSTAKTARFYLTGHTFQPEFKYTFQLALGANDFGAESASPLFDAYVDYVKQPWLSVRAGQFFVPFDRARTVREFSLQMTERPRVVGELTLDRDVGVMLYSSHSGDDAPMFAYKVGVFGGAGRNGVSDHAPGALGVARVELRPLGPIDDDSEGDLARREAPGLALGLGAAYNLNSARARSTTGAVYAGGTVDYLHLAADAVFKARGFAVLGEVVMRDAARDSITSVAEDGTELVEYARSGWGYVVQPSYMLTQRWELSARWSQMHAFEGTDPTFISDMEKKGNEVAVGVDWYANGHRLKVQGDWVALFGSDFAAAQHAAHASLDVSF